MVSLMQVVDFHQMFGVLVQALGPLCVLFAPTLAIERALKNAIKADEKINSDL